MTAMTQIDDVKSRLDIVELIASYVNLQRSGSSLKANCPFHQERTPSFYVFPDRQSWRCFGACAEGGDAFSFVMKADRVDFREALQRLAQRVGITLVNNQESGGVSRQLYEINDVARRFFQQMLGTPEARFVREYLADREINDRSLQTFEFGYSPPRGNLLLEHLTQSGYSTELIVQAGLARETDDGRYYDLFRGRLMIPIRDWEARVAGFGSRALDAEATPKYLNTPRTPVFDKSRILFAMNLSKEPVRQHGAVIVEGYMDAIMAHQHGFDNVVASMGTALTEHQVALVRRLTSDVTMALDGDPAGRNATLRSLESSWGVFQQRNAQQRSTSVLQQPGTLALRVAELPSGLDPDDFIRQSPERWQEFLGNAQELFDYLLVSLADRADMDNPEGKSWVAHTMLRFVARIPDRIQRDLYVDRLSARLSVDSAALRAALQEIERQAAREQRAQPPASSADEATPAPASDHDATEEYLLALYLQHGEHLKKDNIAEVTENLFRRSENREIFRNVICNAPDVDPEVVPELEPHLANLRSRDLRLSNLSLVERDWERTVWRIERRNLTNEIQELYDAMDGTESLDDQDSPIVLALRHVATSIGELDKRLAPPATAKP